MTGLTDRQRDVLGFMLAFCADNGRPPSVTTRGRMLWPAAVAGCGPPGW